MNTRLAARLLPLAGIALALALLYPEPDHDALLAQGVHQLLEGEAGAAIFDALAERGADAERFQLAIEHDGRRVEGVPVFRRPFDSLLNVVNDELGTSLSAVEGPAELRLELVLEEEERALTLRAAVVRGSGVQRFDALGPWILPTRTALLPPLLAIAVALALRATVTALFLGILSGAVLMRMQTDVSALFVLPAAFWDVFAVYLRREILDTFRLEVIGFTVALIAMVGVMTRSGGVMGMIQQVARFAQSVRSTLAVAFASGLGLFFDDYSNCLIVGNSMRPLTDRLSISREKLAYIVDSTAAPVAGLSVVSTWIAFEVSTFAPQLPAAGIVENAYAIFFQTIPFRFYSIFALCFVALVIWTGRDFGPMATAERRARNLGQLVRDGGTPMVSSELTGLQASSDIPPRASNALMPILAVVLVALQEIFRRGGGYAVLADDPARLLTLPGITGVLLDGSGAAALFTASCVGLFLSVFLSGSNGLRGGLVAGVLAAVAFGPPLEGELGAYLGERLAGPLAYTAMFAAGWALVGWALGLWRAPRCSARVRSRSRSSSCSKPG